MPYRATIAHALAHERASRPRRPSWPPTGWPPVEQDNLQRRFSPEQIAGRLRRQFPAEPEMWVSPETIYQSLYVHSRGALKRELTRYLRTGRAPRKPHRQAGQRKNRIPDMVNIAQRPPEADDRRVPGHWERDHSIGKRNQAAIATLVQRASGFAMLVALPDGYKPEHVAPALASKMQTLPDALRRPITWAKARRCATASRCTSTPGSTCTSATRSPLARGSNENTNGLLRQYFPKGTDFSTIPETHLDAVADELNHRPRKRLGFANPTEQLAELLFR